MNYVLQRNPEFILTHASGQEVNNFTPSNSYFDVEVASVNEEFYIDVRVKSRDFKDDFTIYIPVQGAEEAKAFHDVILKAFEGSGVTFGSNVQATELKEQPSGTDNKVPESWWLPFSTITAFYFLGLSLRLVLEFLKKSAYKI